jgi:hypothetical protein
VWVFWFTILQKEIRYVEGLRMLVFDGGQCMNFPGKSEGGMNGGQKIYILL